MIRERRQHLLRHNNKTQLPLEFIFFDTETKGVAISDYEEEHHLWFGYAIYRNFRADSVNTTRQIYRITDIDTFWDWVESKTRPHTRIWLFAHNTAFDFRILKGFTQLSKRGWKMNIPIFDRMRFLITWRKDRATIIISDTMNYFPVSLAKLGESVDFPKMPMPDKDMPQEEWDKYCFNDVQVIEKVITDFRDFVQSEDLGNWGMTEARQALNAYQHRFMSYPIEVHSNEKASELELECYHGGRVEAFRIGEIPWNPIFKLDVNSMYPYVMATNDYPTALLEYVYDIPPIQVKHICDSFILMGLCEVNTPEPVYSRSENGKLTFPIGRFAVSLTHGEIEYALEHRHLIRFVEGYVYRRKPIFKEYVDYFYTMRKEYKQVGNAAFTEFCKRMLNCLYGKFGQQVPETNVIGTANYNDASIEYHIDAQTGERWREITIGGIIYREGDRHLSYNSFPAIAACVTGYARIYLWKLITEAGIDNVAYCDTDSIVTNKIGYERLTKYIDSNRLGALKLEGEAKKGVIRGLKDYQLDDIIHMKGVRPDAKEVAPGVYEVTHVPGIRTTLLHGEPERVVFIRLHKHLGREYDKGMILPDGRILPYSINEILHDDIVLV